MGGNCLGVGNQSRCAEFNFFADPEAAYIALSTAKCPITILPWEACLNDKIRMSLVRLNELNRKRQIVE